MAETETHLRDMIDTIQVLDDHFADRPDVYVCGNLLLYYEEGNPRKHVSPDVLVALDVPKKPNRDYYLVWKEGNPGSRRRDHFQVNQGEDQKKKFEIYRGILRVSEYFLFDPTEDYLDPPLQGFRLARGRYVAIKPIAGRLPSAILGLHLERDGTKLRLFDPTTGHRLLTPLEGREAAEHRAAEEHRRGEGERHRAEAAEAAQQRLAEENERLRREIEALRRG